MISCSIAQIIEATGAKLLAGADTITISGVEIDSRNIAEGNLFVAFPGERVDGNTFAATALEAGAAAVVLTREPEPGVVETAETRGAAVLLAAPKPEDSVAEDDATEFMLRLAAWWRLQQDWCVVGVTGSVGKTTTKDMLKAALGVSYHVYANVGNHNNLVGVPLTIFETPVDTEVLVCEMGMNHKGEIARLASVARPAVAAITNVGTSHIGILGSRENIARAKGEIVSWLAKAPAATVAPEPALYLTAENDFSAFVAQEFAAPAGVPVYYVGTGANTMASASHIELDEDARPSFEVKLTLNEGTTTAPLSWQQSLSLTGAQVVPDYLLALAIAVHLGINPSDAGDALAQIEPTHMRQEMVRAAVGCRIIDDSYNASPDSTAAALDALCSMKVEAGGRRIAILGEIGELGEQENRLHELVGAYAAAKNPDVLVIVGTTRADHMESAAKLMGFSEDKMVRVSNVEMLTSVMASVLEPADLVLVKASRAAELDRFVKAVCASC